MRIYENQNLLKRPFEVSAFSGHFVFSHGHFLQNASYENNLINLFIGEESF